MPSPVRTRRGLVVTGFVALLGAAAPGVWALADVTDSDQTLVLPELPSVDEAVDGLYDEQGCLRTGIDEVDCSVRADEVDEALSHGGATETRHLEGFVGTRWLGRVTGAGAVVLEHTVQTGADGVFVASGLARNEGTDVVETLTVTAHLYGADGRELAVVSAEAGVHDVRPGEPAPFTVRSAVPRADVARVTWAAEGAGDGDEADRSLSWTAYWERPAGGEPVELYLYEDPVDDRPHLLFGSVAAVGAGIDDPEVVVAWLSQTSRLVGFTVAPVRGPDGEPLDRLEAGGAADALVVAPAAPPVGAEAIVWVQGS